MTHPISDFGVTGVSDPRRAQTALTNFDAPDRAYVDQQIVDVQQTLERLMVNGVVGTIVRLDGAYTGAKGDVVCLSSTSPLCVRLASSSNINAAGGAFGVLMLAAPAGSRGVVALDGALDPSVTGLGAVAGPVRVSSAGRCERVAALIAGDYPIGAADANGRLTLTRASPSIPSAGSVTFLDVYNALANASSDLDLNGFGVSNSSVPGIDGTDLATVAYVDAAYTNGAGLTLTTGTFAINFGEVGDVDNIEAGDTAAAGSTGEAADAGHRHAVVSNSTGTASQLTAYGASGQLTANWFQPSGVTVAGTGVVRSSSNSTIVAAHDAAASNTNLMAWSASDILTLGSSPNVDGIALAMQASASLLATFGGTTLFEVSDKGVGLFGAVDGGGGTGNVKLSNESGAPSSAPTAGVRFRAVSGALKVESSNGVVTTAAAVGSGSATTQVQDRQWAKVQTTNSTPTTLLTIAVPTSVVGRIAYYVEAISGTNGAWFERVSRITHNGTDAVLVETLTPTGIADREDMTGSPTIGVSQSGDDVVLTATGVDATTINWKVRAEVDFFRP